MPRDLLFVDIANIAGRDRFIFYQSGIFSWFDPDDGESNILLSAPFKYNGKLKKQVPWVNMTKDLNQDHLDEFILPGIDGFSIFIQNDDGTFSDPLKLGPPEPCLNLIATGDTRTYREVGLNALTIPWYLSRVHFYDHNLDGRKDLVFRNRDHYDVHIQTETGMFDPVSSPFKTDVKTGTDGPYSLAFQFSGKGDLSLVLGLRKSSTHTYLRSISDINGDGIADILTHTLAGRSPLKMKSKYTIYYGTETKNGTDFTEQNRSIIFPTGKSGLGETAGYSTYWFHDFNGDNKKDLFRYDVRFGLGSIMRTLLFKTVYIDYEYFQNKNDIFPTAPNVKGLLKTTFDWDAGFYPAIKIGDVNGDGKTEAAITMSPEEIHFYTWNNEKNILSNHPQIVSSTVPGSELNTWMYDLNGDKKKDIVMYHPSELDAHRLIILMAR